MTIETPAPAGSSSATHPGTTSPDRYARMAGLLYLLFEPVSRAASLVAAVVAVGAMVGEVPFMLWLLIKGVDVEAWNARVAATVGTAD